MVETLHTVAAFVVAIALLIAVHEFGHFIVARKLGIKVEKFSIGFGPALFSWRSRDREVQYIIAAIPLGGYVKMLGEMATDEPIPEHEKIRAFDTQPIWKRAAVATAGPAFNFLFAIMAYMLVGWIGQSVLPPVVGHVSPASVAEQAGILAGDKIISVDGKAVHSWRKLEEHLKDHVGRDIAIGVRRAEAGLSFQLTLPALTKEPLLADVADEALGISPGIHVVVEKVLESSPASMAGLKAGDRILQIQGVAVVNVREFIRLVREHAGTTVTLGIYREKTMLNVRIVPRKDGEGRGRIGVKIREEPLHAPVIYRMGVFEGFGHGFARTWEMTSLTLQVLGKMISRSISPENLGGPIAIAQLAGKTAELGLVPFILFLALISVNLAVLNLLPIPVLDGGHLAYLGIEKIMGRPLSPKMLERTQIIGMAVIILLMVFAFYNDIARLFRG